MLGRRPAGEGLHRRAGAASPPTARNRLAGGMVSDVSFIGVSTQYLVRMPWGQELTVFEQNTGARRRFRAGDAVDLHWSPAHTFLLDADAGRATPASSRRRTAADERRSAAAAAERRRRPASRTSRPRAGAARRGYWLLLPGMLWLVVFFVVPTSTLVATSLYDPTGSLDAGYEMTWSLRELLRRASATTAAVPPVVAVRRHRDGLCAGARLPARLRDRVQGRPLEEPHAGRW